MVSSLGGAWSTPGKTIVHFGSPDGTTYSEQESPLIVASVEVNR